MISDELRRRISLLNRAALKSSTLNTDARVGRLPFVAGPGALILEQALPGRVIASPPSHFFLIERRLTDLHHSAEGFVDRFRFCFAGGHLPAILDPTRLGLVQYDSSRWLFLDIESCGLSNSPVFLVGLMQFSGSDFQLLQLLARDYSEEAAVLSYLAGLLQSYDVLVTFNGKTFDLPFLQDRGAVHCIPLPRPAFHFDVLHAARKQWGRAMPNCKLQTLERFICKRIRSGDIPGEQIPDAYHEFVKTGNAERIVEILHHNALDLLTMSELTLNLFGEDDMAFL